MPLDIPYFGSGLVPIWYPYAPMVPNWYLSEVKAGIRADCTDQYLARFLGHRGALGRFQPSAHCDSTPEKARVSCSTSNSGLPLLHRAGGAVPTVLLQS